jgi:tetrahydromethanopterin S-methyltransferase subunit F
MPQNKLKEKTDRFLEIRNPEKAVGLWSCHADFSTTLRPVEPTRTTLGKFFNYDLERFETHAEALEMMRAKGWKKTPSRKLKEFAAQYLGEKFDENGKGEWSAVPRWFRAWRSFAKWLTDCKTAKPYTDVRLSFGSPMTGVNCSTKRHRTSRVIFLRKNGRKFVAVMLKEGWHGWQIIEKPAYGSDPYERLILSGAKGAVWQTTDADMITELVLGKMMCLFEMEDDAMFDALTDQKNGAERFGAISRDFEFYVHDPNGAGERFYMTWSATFNPRKRKYEADDRQKPRLVETRAEIGKGWISRRIEVTDPAKAVEAARWVAENNGCVVLPANPKDELRIAVMRALFYITFPEREIDAPGGLLRGYQLPGRMVRFATKKIRYDGIKAIVEDVRQKSQKAIERKRRLVVDTLLGRAANAVAVRNGLDREEALKRIEGVDGRAVIETAAWRWGFMDGNAITLFAATPQAGSLKLPDLSLALGFEHRLGLDGGKATAGRLVQTAQITPLRDSVDTMRFCREVKIKAKRVSAPRRGTEGDRVAYSADTVRIMRDEGNYYLLAIPKYARYKYGRDLLFAPGSESVAVHTYRCVAEGGTRARDRSRMEEEQLDFNKITGLARDGRVYLYSLDVGGDRWLFDAVYSTENKSPCRLVPTIPQLFQLGSAAKTCPSRKQNGMNIITDVPVDDEVAVAKIMFVFNPTVPRDGRKRGGRSWKAYCDAHPGDAGREAVVWPTGEATEKTLRDAVLRVVETDGILLTDDSHLDAALDGMGYVVTQTDDPHGIGGVYRGYIISDRVFKLSDGRDEWRAAVKGDTKPDGKAQEKEKRLQMSGKPLCGVLSPKVAAEAEKEFSKLIEAEVLSDKKTAKFFTLEAPIVIGKEFKDMVSREFRRVVYTGTMGWRQQLVRPSHEVALGIWLARLSGGYRVK